MTRIAIAFMLFLTLVASAAEESAFVEIARLRQYPGGSDESDLKVRPVLPQSKDKKKKQVKPETNEGF